jgi:hypothetical protein
VESCVSKRKTTEVSLTMIVLRRKEMICKGGNDIAERKSEQADLT